MSENEITIRPSVSELTSKLNRRRKELTDFSIPFKKAAIFLDKWVEQNFKTEGGKVGGWKPFAHGGRVTEKGIDENAKLLQDTRRLRMSYLPFANKKTAGIGSDVSYSVKHEKGLDGTPQRRMLPKKREVIDDVRKIMNNHAEQVASRGLS